MALKKQQKDMGRKPNSGPVISISDENKDNTPSGSKKRLYDNIAKVICVFLAIIIWLYVMEVDSTDHETTFSAIPLELENTEMLENMSGLTVYNGYGAVVDVKVRGKKSEVNKISADDIIVYADLSGITMSGTYLLDVHVNLPSSLTLVEMSRKSVSVYVDERDTVTVEVKPKITSVSVETPNVLGDPVPEYDTITVTGPKQALDNISHAQINLELGKMTTSVTSIGKLELYSRSGNEITNPYIRLSRTEMSVTVPLYGYKSVPLEVQFKNGFYNDSNVSIEIDPAEIRLMGDPAVLAGIESLVLTTIDERDVIEDEVRRVLIPFPNGVESADMLDSATVFITHIGTATRTLTLTNIEVRNGSKIDYELLENTAKITVRGPADVIGRVRAGYIHAYIDLAGYSSDTSATIYETLQFDESNVIGEGVYVVGEYKVQVKLN